MNIALEKSKKALVLLFNENEDLKIENEKLKIEKVEATQDPKIAQMHQEQLNLELAEHQHMESELQKSELYVRELTDHLHEEEKATELEKSANNRLEEESARKAEQLAYGRLEGKVSL